MAVPVQLTPDALIDRLTTIYEASSREDLARRLDVPLRSLQRWATGGGIEFDTAIRLLQLAGWVTAADDAEADDAARRERARKLANQVADRMEQLVRVL